MGKTTTTKDADAVTYKVTGTPGENFVYDRLTQYEIDQFIGMGFRVEKITTQHTECNPSRP